MKPYGKALIIIIALTFMGCAGQGMIDLTEKEVASVEAMKTSGRNLLKTWPFYSGLIRGAMGKRINELPKSAIDAMDRLDELTDEENPITDKMIGESVGLRIHLLAKSVQMALETFAPDVWAILPRIL